MNEEILNIGEQPSSAEVHAVATEIENGTEMPIGSPLGKFKDASTLLNAYNELQSEFTRKCQRLSDAEKKLQELNVEKISAELKTEVEKELTWNDKIREFLDTYENASDFVEDIIGEIVNNENLKNESNGLEKAYVRVLERNYIPQNELVNNQDFLDKYIYSNDQIKNKIIEDYVSTLQQNKSPITVSNDGFSRGVASSNNFGSLEEARKYVENMFKF